MHIISITTFTNLPIVYVCWASLVLFLLTKNLESFRLIPIAIMLRVFGVIFSWLNRIVETAQARKVRRDIAILHDTLMNEYNATTSGTQFRRKAQAVKLGIGANPTVQKIGMYHFRNFLRKASSANSPNH